MFGQPGRMEKELSSRSLDYTATILDEIALEGLDGITLQGKYHLLIFKQVHLLIGTFF